MQLGSATEAKKRWRYGLVEGIGKRTWGWEAEGSPLLEAIAREHLVKRQQDGEGLMVTVVIFKMWRFVIVL
jgi:hypothetical protein